MYPEQITIFDLLPPDTLDLASLSVTPGSDEARKMTVTSGRKLSEYLRKSDPVGLLAKMLLDTSVWGSTTCLLTWGGRVTPRKHFLYQLRPSVPATDETECSLWPTPRANKIGGESSPGFSPTLEQTVKMWPTPVTNDAKNATLPPAAKEWDNIPGALIRTGHQGQLNPAWVETLMNFPPGWTEV